MFAETGDGQRYAKPRCDGLMSNARFIPSNPMWTRCVILHSANHFPLPPAGRQSVSHFSMKIHENLIFFDMLHSAPVTQVTKHLPTCHLLHENSQNCPWKTSQNILPVTVADRLGGSASGQSVTTGGGYFPALKRGFKWNPSCSFPLLCNLAAKCRVSGGWNVKTGI